MLEIRRLEDDMKERNVPGKQVKMASASLRRIKNRFSGNDNIKCIGWKGNYIS